MESKHQKTSSTVRRSAISVKRKCEEGFQRPSKRSRTSLSPSNQESRNTSSSGLGFSEGTFSRSSGYPQSLSSTRSEENKTSRKRKSTAGETEEGPRKRSRKQNIPASSNPKNPGTFSSADAFYAARRAVFEAKYKLNQLLGKGFYGAVYAGFRKADNVPVAIKFMDKSRAAHTVVIQDAKVRTIPLEVVLLQKVQPTDSGSCAAITLLDWFDLERELILVLERPAPCMDLFDYIRTKGPLPEPEAKIIAKQLVDALIDIESRGVFHRDIKLENILIETSFLGPRVRIIDFGCGTYLSEGFYTSGKGTCLYQPPELFQNRCYKAKQATVWQLGVTLYAVLHKNLPFKDIRKLVHINPPLNENLSIGCQRFLQGCLSKNPESRATLERLKGHPWLE